MTEGTPVTTPSGKTSSGLINVHSMLEARHGSTSLGMDMTALMAYPRTETSLLMQSPCRPEEDGYFGATYGTPSKILYEFEMETRAGADIDYAVEIVQEHLMDVVLSVTFPSICSYEGDGRPPAKKTQDVVITGFRFGREELDMSRTCLPMAGQGNYCNRFSGQLYIFGSDIDETVKYAQSVVNFAILGALSQVQSVGVQRVETVQIIPVDASGDRGISSFSLPVLCGLIVSAVCAILGIFLLILYMRQDRVRHQKLHKRAQRTMMESLSGSYKYFTPDGRHADEMENDSCTSDISSVQIDFENGRVSKMPTEKVDVEFDPDYASSCGLVTDTSSYNSSRKESDPGLETTMSHPPHYLDDFGRYRD